MRLSSSWRRNRSSSISASGPGAAPPTPATMPSSLPKRSLIAETTDARSSSDRTSAATASISAPICSTAAVTSSSASGVRAWTTTLAPARARCSATPRPMPRDEPVSQTTFPARPKPVLIGRWYVDPNGRDARTDAGGRRPSVPRRHLHDRVLGERAAERRDGRRAASGRDRASGLPLPRAARRRRRAGAGHLRALPRRVGGGRARGRVPLGPEAAVCGSARPTACPAGSRASSARRAAAAA